MKQDYLWDKTGEDPEIEKLENALSAFRYRETAPPELPAKVIPFPNKAPRRFFRLSFAFAACAALIIVSLGVWFQFSVSKVEVAKDSTETTAPQKVEKALDEIRIENGDSLTINHDLAVINAGSLIRKHEVSKQSAGRKTIKVKNVVPVTASFNKNATVAQKSEIRKPEVKLTKEEKYAYDQLMLALSITSSKLKIVKDKVEGVEEQSAAFSGSR